MFVMVPRDVAAEYWHRPWTLVKAAAERGDDGLQVRQPSSLWRPTPPKPESYPEMPELYKKALAAWTEEQNVCFLYEGGHGWPRNKTLLFQQNW